MRKAVILIPFILTLLAALVACSAESEPPQSVEAVTPSATEPQVESLSMRASDVPAFIKEYIVTNSTHKLSYIDIHGNIADLMIIVGIRVESEDDLILSDVGDYISQVAALYLEAKSEADWYISLKLLQIGISDMNDNGIVTWLSEDGEVGLLNDNRFGGSESHRDINYLDVKTVLEGGDE